MLQALTDRERRTLLAILAVLALGAAVKLWRWKTGQELEPVRAAELRASGATDDDADLRPIGENWLASRAH